MSVRRRAFPIAGEVLGPMSAIAQPHRSLCSCSGVDQEHGAVREIHKGYEEHGAEEGCDVDFLCCGGNGKADSFQRCSPQASCTATFQGKGQNVDECPWLDCEHFGSHSVSHCYKTM
jgi:hypothetical protein